MTDEPNKSQEQDDSQNQDQDESQEQNQEVVPRPMGILDGKQKADQAKENLNIFGNREYITQYRGDDSYKWNPEDERLQFAWISVHLGENAEISGEIYKWN